MTMFKVEVRENTQYQNEETSHYLEIVEGNFTGMHFTFGKIEFLGEDDEGNGNIQFDYRLLFLPEEYDYEDPSQKEQIEKTISLALEHILMKAAEEKVSENETGNIDTEQSSEG